MNSQTIGNFSLELNHYKLKKTVFLLHPNLPHYLPTSLLNVEWSNLVLKYTGDSTWQFDFPEV